MEERMHRLLDLGYSPLEVQGIFYDEIRKALDKVESERYLRIAFDSPQGSSSRSILRRHGYMAEWFGHVGCRGETRVYLPKTKSFEDFKQILEALELLDNYSIIQEI